MEQLYLKFSHLIPSPHLTFLLLSPKCCSRFIFVFWKTCNDQWSCDSCFLYFLWSFLLRINARQSPKLPLKKCPLHITNNWSIIAMLTIPLVILAMPRNGMFQMNNKFRANFPFFSLRFLMVFKTRKTKRPRGLFACCNSAMVLFLANGWLLDSCGNGWFKNCAKSCSVACSIRSG